MNSVSEKDKTSNKLFICTAALSALISIAAAALWCLNSDRIPKSDESLHILNCYSLLHGHTICPDNRSHYPAPGYYIMTLFTLLKPTVYNIWIPNAFIASGVFISLMALGRKTGWIYSSLAAAAVFMSPLFGSSLRICFIDNPFAAFAGICAVCLILSDNFKIRKWSLAAGTALGIGSLCKIGILFFTGIPFFFALFWQESTADKSDSTGILQKIKANLPKKDQLINFSLSLLIAAAYFFSYCFRAPKYIMQFMDPIVAPSNGLEPYKYLDLQQTLNSIFYTFVEWVYGWPLLFIICASALISLIYRIKSKKTLRPWLTGFLSVFIPAAIMPFLYYQQVHYSMPLVPLSIIWTAFCLKDAGDWIKQHTSSQIPEILLLVYTVSFTMLWNFYPLFNPRMYDDNKIEHAARYPRTSNFNLASTSCTAYGVCLPFYDNLCATAEIAEQIVNSYHDYAYGPYPLGKGKNDYPYVLLGDKLPEEMNYPQLDMYRRIANLEDLCLAEKKDRPNLDRCRFYIADEKSAPPSGNWILVKTYEYQEQNVNLWRRAKYPDF